MNIQTRKFSVFLTTLILLATLLSVRTPPVAAQAPQAAAGRSTPSITPIAQTDLQKVLQAKLDEYLQKAQPTSNGSFILGQSRSNGVFAYNTAQEVDANGQIVAESYVVILARNHPGRGWFALAPIVDMGDEYNDLLNSFPENMIDKNTKNYLQQPSSAIQAFASSNFSQHKLPFPAGKSGHVGKKEASGHENQIDFNISPGNTIFASKPGTVVFVKESSTTNCTTPPPDNCWQNANMVVIQHASGEYSWYVHLVYNSVPVNVGSYVGFGTKIGDEGMTGFASGVHLHYMASNSVPASWPNPSIPNVAPWPPAYSILPVDFDEASWSNLVLGNSYVSQNTSDPSAVAWGYGREDLFVHGEDNVLWHKALSGGSWGAWEPLDGILMSSPDAASWGSGHLDVYVRGLDNNIWYRRYLNGAWADWAPADQPSVGARSDPSAVSWGNGRIDLFVRGGDNALWHRAYNAGWGNWEPLGGTLTTGPDAASPASGQIQVFVAGINNVMWRCTYYGSGTCTWDQVPEGLARYDQGAVSPSANRVDVFARGTTDGQLWHKPWTGSSWGAWEPLGGFLTSGVDVASWKGGHLDVFLRGTDNNVWHRWLINGLWSGWDPLGAPPSP